MSGIVAQTKEKQMIGIEVHLVWDRGAFGVG